MILHLIRYAYMPECTLGMLKFPVPENPGDKVGPAYGLWTVEQPFNGNIPFQSSIPDGTYPMTGFDSERHPGCWIVSPVPGRTGILLHAANHAHELQGCIAPGLNRDGLKVLESRDAMRCLNYVLDRQIIHQLVIGPGLGAVLPDEPEHQADHREPDSDPRIGDGHLSDGPTD